MCQPFDWVHTTTHVNCLCLLCGDNLLHGSPFYGSFTLHGTWNKNGTGNGTGNDGFICYAITVHTTQRQGQGTEQGMGTIEFYTHFPVPGPVPCPVPIHCPSNNYDMIKIF